ncbi:DUF4870 domain-containing protein [Maribacter sp. ACAM166]|uniref:DUF4870 domain-containing protein n=1 Tax=Maribacter sp. ACAM166 TaxID=2508996 RepID=UPI0010FDDD3D|nr:hypothetical protein [Maribacter sp. ACAM166]TLP74285.1 hypothetical protein ES765_16465 [Maribacter sp. ACAM166]
MESVKLETNETSSTSLQEEGKTTAIIAYITIIGLIIAFVINNEKKNAFASYHIRQSLGLALTALVLSLINIIPILGWIISFLGFFLIVYLWVMGLINAINLKEKPLPILGKKYEEWFKSIK